MRPYLGLFVLVVFFFTILSFQNCGKFETLPMELGSVNGPQGVRATDAQVKSILENRCAACHLSMEPIDIANKEKMIAEGFIIPGNAAGSKLYIAVTLGSTATGVVMPSGMPPLPQAELDILRDWIDVTLVSPTPTPRPTATPGLPTPTPTPTPTPQYPSQDMTPPVVTLMNPPPAYSNNRNPVFEFTVTDSGGSGVKSAECQIDNLAWQACTSPKAYSNLNAGQHSFKARASDNRDNLSQEVSHNWTLDLTQPQIQITSPNNNSTVSGTITITAIVSDDTNMFQSVQFKVDGVNLGGPDLTAPWGAVLNTATLTNGMHTVSATVTDAAGNTRAAQNLVNVNNGGATPTPTPTPAPPTFTQLKSQIFTPRCITCHGSGSRNYNNYQAVRADVVPGQADQSPLYHQVSTNQMPKTGNPLTDAQKKMIFDWIQAGALNN